MSSFTIYAILFSLVVILDVVIFFVSRNERAGGKAFRNLVIICALVTIAYFLAVTVTDAAAACVFYSAYYICATFCCAALLSFVAMITEPKFGVGFKNALPLVVLVMVVADSLIVAFNPLAGHVISLKPTQLWGRVSYTPVPRMYFYVHLGICYLLLTGVFCLLIWKLLNTPGIYRIRYGGLLVSLAIVVGLNVIYTVGEAYFDIDISTLTYSLEAAFIFYGTYYYLPRKILDRTTKFLSSSPAAFPMVVFDHEGYLLYTNPPAAAIFPEHGKNKYAISTDKIADFIASYDIAESALRGIPFEYKPKDSENVYRGDFQEVTQSDGKLIATLAILRDISHEKDSVTGYNLTGSLMKAMSDVASKDYPVQIVAFNVSGLSVINRVYGRDYGDEIMKMLANAIKIYFDGSNRVSKMDDGTIVIAGYGSTKEEFTKKASSVKQLMTGDNRLGIPIEVEYGVTEVESPDTLPVLALDEALSILNSKKLLGTQSRASALIRSLTQSLLESDYETETHVMRTRKTAVFLAKEMGLDEKTTGQLELLCILHDIGKLGIPYEILSKPSKLDDTEWTVMKTHCDRGYRIALASPDLEPIAIYIHHHHERWDGTGYPSHFKGEEIPYLSRLMTVLDSFDVMTHDRPYHKAIPVEDAKAELIRCKGTQFEPAVVDAFLRIVDKVEYQ